MAYKFTHKFLSKSFTYQSYRDLIDTLLAEGKAAENIKDSSMLQYTELNVGRMNRIDNTTEIKEDLNRLIKAKQHWVVITEGWCGDAANIVPVIAKMCEKSENAELHILLRDENPEVMDEYLTNGTRSIPMLIVLDEKYNEIFVWGPRPAELQQYVLDYKKQERFDIDELKKEIQMWYFNDKTVSTQKEIMELIKRY